MLIFSYDITEKLLSLSSVFAVCFENGGCLVANPPHTHFGGRKLKKLQTLVY